MDGMKLDEAYRQKNGLGPAAPEPKTTPEEPVYRFSSAGVDGVRQPLQATDTQAGPAVESGSPTAGGFIDKVLSEKDVKKAKKAKKAKKVKPPKPPKAPKIKPIPPPKPVDLPKPPRPVSAPAAKPQPKPRSVSSRSPASQLVTIGKVVIFVAVVVFSLYNFLEIQRLNDLLNTEVGQQSQNEVKNKELINAISAFRLLPDGEYEVYTVKDKSKLAEDPVFDYAENGDKVVVYPSNSLTIVYRESEGKIVSESKNSVLTENAN
jgi:hypothetical protein